MKPPLLPPVYSSLALFILRAVFGVIMFLDHGFDKLKGFFGGPADQFADPIGLGKSLSFFLAAFSEGVCSLLVAVGLLARLASIPPFITMLVAALVVHGGDPLSKREPAILYATFFLTIILAGPGDLSLDHLILSKAKLRK